MSFETFYLLTLSTDFTVNNPRECDRSALCGFSSFTSAVKL